MTDETPPNAREPTPKCWADCHVCGSPRPHLRSTDCYVSIEEPAPTPVTSNDPVLR